MARPLTSEVPTGSGHNIQMVVIIYKCWSWHTNGGHYIVQCIGTDVIMVIVQHSYLYLAMDGPVNNFSGNP